MRAPITEEQLLEAADPLTSPSRLRELAKRPAFHLNLAKNPATPSAVLLELSTSRSSWVKRAVAQNPSAPKEALLALAQEYPREFIENPAFPLLLMESPDLLQGIPITAWAGLLSLPTGEQMLSSILESKPVHYREMLAQSPQVSEDILRRLATQEPRVQKSVASNHRCPLDILSTLAQSPEETLREEVAKHPRLPTEHITAMASDRSARVRRSISSRKDLPEHLFAMLSQDKDDEVKQSIARHSQTPEDVLCALAREPDQRIFYSLLHRLTPRILIALCENPNESLRRLLPSRSPSIEILQKLARDESLSVRRSVASTNPLPASLIPLLFSEKNLWPTLASNPSVPTEVLTQLSLRPSADIALALAGNKSTPDTILRSLLPHATEELKQSISKNPNASVETIELLIRECKEETLRVIAKNPRTPTSVILELAKDPKLSTSLVYNPKCPAEILSSLAHRADLAGTISAHPMTNTETLLLLAEKKLYFHSMASHPNTSPEILRELSNASSSLVRLEIAKSPLAPPDVLSQLATDPDRVVRQSALRHPNLPIDALQHALRSGANPDVLPRRQEMSPSALEELLPNASLACYLAHHPNTTEKILIALSKDHRRRVRRAVAFHPNTPKEIRLALTLDPSSSVRSAARSSITPG